MVLALDTLPNGSRFTLQHYLVKWPVTIKLFLLFWRHCNAFGWCAPFVSDLHQLTGKNRLFRQTLVVMSIFLGRKSV